MRIENKPPLVGMNWLHPSARSDAVGARRLDAFGAIVACIIDGQGLLARAGACRDKTGCCLVVKT